MCSLPVVKRTPLFHISIDGRGPVFLPSLPLGSRPATPQPCRLIRTPLGTPHTPYTPWRVLGRAGLALAMDESWCMGKRRPWSDGVTIRPMQFPSL